MQSKTMFWRKENIKRVEKKKKKERGNVTAAGADGTITHFIPSAVAAASVRGAAGSWGNFRMSVQL